MIWKKKVWIRIWVIKLILRSSSKQVWKWRPGAHSRTSAELRQERSCTITSQRPMQCHHHKSTIWRRAPKWGKRFFTELRTDSRCIRQYIIMTSSHQVAQEQRMESARRISVSLMTNTMVKGNMIITCMKCKRRKSSTAISSDQTSSTTVPKWINLAASWPNPKSRKTRMNQTIPPGANRTQLIPKPQSKEDWETQIANSRITTMHTLLSSMTRASSQDFLSLITTNK